MITSTPTTSGQPIFRIDDINQLFCFNVPATILRISSSTLINVPLLYILKLANLGCKEALLSIDCLNKGVKVIYGRLAC